MTREEKIKSLEVLKRKLDGKLLSYMNSCVRCGLCAESCHYYKAEQKASYIPGYKVKQVGAIFSGKHTILGKLMPFLSGSMSLDDKSAENIFDAAFGSCSMCGRCTMHCSIGLDIAYIMRTARAMLTAIGKVPKGLKSTADTALATGNNMGIPQDELVDTLKWLEEDLQMEVNDNRASIPIDKTGAKILYTLNPREPKFFPLSISAIAKIFYAAREDWTISSRVYDVTNYSYFMGDDACALELTKRHMNQVQQFGSEILALAECGHGFRAYRWEGPNWAQEKYDFKAVSVLELIAGYIREGRIKTDKSKYTKKVTLHDPCNLVRNGGIIEEQRFILKNTVSDFVEMYPNRENNFCCGGGGGQLAMSEFSERRIKAGRIKAEQIRATGASVVATPCHNCIDQLMELNKEYKLNVEIKTISEIVAATLVL